MKMNVGHVEGGIRSGDRTMPEEINRLVTDSISDVFFTTTELASENLIKEGHSRDNIYLVGNTMIDSLLKQMPNLKPPAFFDEFQLSNSKYFVHTLHLPSNVDNPIKFKLYLDNIADSSGTTPVIFPVHPRTRNIMISNNIKPEGVYLVDPMSYLEFNYLVRNSAGVITDSGGITEETTVMGIPCKTLRDNTERPETCSIGTNELIGTNPENIPFYLNKLKNGDWKRGAIPPLWDGHAADRIVEKIISHFNIK
jgi:UDP-N-acetylglucosamine 2-epimerase (non-hydrolysing)